MANVFITPQARRDMGMIIRVHLQRSGPSSARKQKEAMYKAFSMLQNYPKIGRVFDQPILRRKKYRYIFIGAYVCIYQLRGNDLYIVHIAHASSNYSRLVYH